MKKKPTTGERIASTAFDPDYYDISVLARRIDRAIAAAVRKERERCAKIVENNEAAPIGMMRRRAAQAIRSGT